MGYGVWAILFLVVLIITNLLADNYEIKTIKINRDVPIDLSPSEVSFLFHGSIEEDGVQATLLKLIHEHKITYQKVGLDYHFTLVVPIETLTEEEQDVIDMLFEGFETITSRDLNEIDKDKYDIYGGKVMNNLVSKGFLTRNVLSASNLLSILLFIVSLFLLFIIIGSGFNVLEVSALILSILLIYILNVDKSISIMLFISYCFIYCNFKYQITNDDFAKAFILYIIFFICSKTLIKHVIKELSYKYTKSGREQRNRILAFKNFVSGFSLLDERKIEELDKWNEYLVYATAVGEGSTISSRLDLKFDTEYTSDDALIDITCSIASAIPFVEMESDSLHREARELRRKEKINRLTVLNNGKRNIRK